MELTPMTERLPKERARRLRLPGIIVLLLGQAFAGCESTGVIIGGNDHLLMPVENSERLPFPGQIAVLAFSSEGHSLTAGGCELPAGGEENCPRSVVQRWNFDRTEHITMTYPQGVTALAISPDGNQVVGGDSEGRLGILKSGIKNFPRAVHQKREITSLAYSPDGKWVASGSLDTAFPLCFFDIKTGGVIKVKPQFEPISALAFSPDSKTLAVGSTKGRFYIWNFNTSSEPIEISLGDRDKNMITRITFSPEGRLVAIARQGGQVLLFDRKAWELRGEFKGSATAKAMAFSPDGRYLALGQDNGRLLLLDATPVKQVWYKRHVLPIADVAYSPDGTSLAVGVQKQIFLYRMYGVVDQAAFHSDRN